MPYYDKARNRWYGQIYVNGRKYKSSKNAGLKTKREALAWEVWKRDEVLHPKLTIPMVTLLSMANAYTEYAEVKFSDNVVSEKKSVFKRFFNFKGVDPLMDVSNFGTVYGRRLALVYAQKQKTARSGNAANKDIKNLKAWWNYGIKYYEAPAYNPFMVDKMPEVRCPRYVPSMADFMKVLEACFNESDRIMLLTFLYTAARRGEIFRLSWSDIDFDNKTIRLSTKKRQDGTLEYDVLPMASKLYPVLKAHRANSSSFNVFAREEDHSHKGNQFLYRNKLMPVLCERAGVKPFGFHAIRHLTATFLCHDGCEQQQIQAILRHKSGFTTERYLKSLGLNKVRAALERLPGTENNVLEFGSTKKNNPPITPEGLEGYTKVI